MDDPFNFYKNIKSVRVAAGLSQRELAKKLNISNKTISAYETGRAVPPTTTLVKIAEITGVSVSDIIRTKHDTDKSNIKIIDRLDYIEERVSSLEQIIIKLINEK